MQPVSLVIPDAPAREPSDDDPSHPAIRSTLRPSPRLARRGRRLRAAARVPLPLGRQVAVLASDADDAVAVAVALAATLAEVRAGWVAVVDATGSRTALAERLGFTPCDAAELLAEPVATAAEWARRVPTGAPRVAGFTYPSQDPALLRATSGVLCEVYPLVFTVVCEGGPLLATAKALATGHLTVVADRDDASAAAAAMLHAISPRTDDRAVIEVALTDRQRPRRRRSAAGATSALVVLRRVDRRLASLPALPLAATHPRMRCDLLTLAAGVVGGLATEEP